MEEAAQPESNRLAVEWFDAKLRQTAAEMDEQFRKYRISDALMCAYKLFWDEFSSWYLELVKPAFGAPLDQATYDATLRFFEALLKLLHPFMPFITEELWQHLYDRAEGDSIMLDSLKISAASDADQQLVADMELVKQVVSGVRTVRNQRNIGPKEPLALEVVNTHKYEPYTEVIKKMAFLSGFEVVDEKSADAAQWMVGTDEFAVPLGNLIDVAEEIKKQEAQLQHLKGFLTGVQKKLQNEKFVAHAPEAVVALERKKEKDATEKIAALEESLAELRKKG